MKSTFVSRRGDEQVGAKWTDIAILRIESIMTQAVWVGTLCLVHNASARIELVPLTPCPNTTNTAAEGILTWSASEKNLIVNGDFESLGFWGWTKQCPANKDFIINQGDYKPTPAESGQPVFSGTASAVSISRATGTQALVQNGSLPPHATCAMLSWADRLRNFAPSYDNPK